MTTQNYLIIESNVVTNVVMWVGNTETWTPPADSIQLIQATTPAMVWELNSEKTDFVLTEKIGLGSIDFTWNGQTLTTNQEKPPTPEPTQATTQQPQTQGTQTL